MDVDSFPPAVSLSSRFLFKLIRTKIITLRKRIFTWTIKIESHALGKKSKQLTLKVQWVHFSSHDLLSCRLLTYGSNTKYAKVKICQHTNVRIPFPSELLLTKVVNELLGLLQRASECIPYELSVPFISHARK